MNFEQLAQSLDPFMDRAGEVYIQVPLEDSDVPHQVPVDSPLARDIVKALLCPLLKKGFPTYQESNTALHVIVGLAFRRPRKEAEYSADFQISRKPLAQAVMAVARKGGTKKELPALLVMLTRTAYREGIDVKKGPWPLNEDALGKQLSYLIPILAAKGVSLTRHGTERPRTWSISALTEESDGRDAQVTDVTSDESQPSGTSDTSARPQGGDGIINDETIQALLNGEQHDRDANEEAHHSQAGGGVRPLPLGDGRELQDPRPLPTMSSETGGQ